MATCQEGEAWSMTRLSLMVEWPCVVDVSSRLMEAEKKRQKTIIACLSPSAGKSPCWMYEGDVCGGWPKL